MPRDYSCALCSSRYDFIPPDGCYCSDSATTIIYDGKESKMLQEKEARENRLRQEESERRDAELKAKQAQKPKPKPQPKPQSSSSSGPVIGFLVFLVVGLYLHFGMGKEPIMAGIIAAIAGIIIRYTYKLIIILIILAVGYYIYEEYIKDKINADSSMIYELEYGIEICDVAFYEDYII